MLTAPPDIHSVNVRAVKKGLELSDVRERTSAVLSALSWDRPEATVEWAHLSDIGRFTVGSFPTSASIAMGKDPAVMAWHFGFRWCVTVDEGALEWFDLKNGLRWRGRSDELHARSLVGLTAQSFADTGRLQPKEVSFAPADIDLSTDPSRRVAERIKVWWEDSCQLHLDEDMSAEAQDAHKDRFTRFVAGVLLLRTIEDMDRVAWLPQGKLREVIDVKSAAQALSDFVGIAAQRLNSRVLSKIARDLKIDIKKKIVRESYELGVDFAALDVDPVGVFYEEILGVDYEHTPKKQRSIFGTDNLDIRENRNARRTHGVYYTPRIYADTLARKLIRPAIRTAESSDELPVIADIAAGSGELLCAAVREILAEPMWHSPKIAQLVLNEKIYAVDRSSLALQLCALNLLRTVIRYVPELLEKNRKLPSLDTNLKEGDALRRETIDSLPKADVVIMNPPFSGPNRWSRPELESAIPELSEVESHPNRAIAFFASAVRLARPGAGLGVIMPSGLFEGPASDLWRRWLADRVSLDLIVSNYGTPFANHSRAGLIVGQRRASDSCWRPRTRVVQIGSNIDPELDTGALLAEMGSDSGVSKKIIPAIDARSPNWLGLKPFVRDTSEYTGKRSLREVMGDQFHQGVVLAPEPWKAALFVFEKRPQGLQHLASGQVMEALSTPSLRPFVNAKAVSKRVPLWCEPKVDNRWVFTPPGVDTWTRIDDLRHTDPGGWKLGNLIRDNILKTSFERNPPSREAQSVYDHAVKGELRFIAPKGFADSSLPMVYASSTSVSVNSRGQGRAWYAWVCQAGDVIPVSGLHIRAPRNEFAAALVAWMTIDDLVSPLVAMAGAPRIDGAVKFNLTAVSQWPIPDLHADRVQYRLEELYATFLTYREEAGMLRPVEALELPSYREVQNIALALWNET